MLLFAPSILIEVFIMAKKRIAANLEKSLQELEAVVESMERGDLSLEQALKHFERGVALTRSCQQALTEAEQQVQILLQDQLEEFTPEQETGRESE